jgi:hypothetical protein
MTNPVGDRAAPPQWSGSVRVTDSLWYCFPDGPQERPLTWHWCTRTNGWALLGTGLHQAHRDAEGHLSLSPSLWFKDCCGMHGFLVNDTWIPA